MVTLQAPVTPRTLGNRENARSRRQHSKRVFVMDAAAIALAMCGTYLLMFGIGESFLDWKQDLRLPYAPVLLVLGIVWFLALQGSVTRRRPTAPAGLEEYVQILSVALKVFGAIAIVSFLLQAHPSRLFFLAALPAGTMLLCLGRVVNRRILDRRRRQGLDFERAVLVGTEVGAAGTFLDVQGHPGSGLCITDVAIVGPDNDVSELRHLPRRTLDDIAESARRGEIDAVLVAPGLAPARVRSLSWALEKSNVNFLL
ncbi:MAG: hypothetical protein Q4F67_05985, partial [Propionibacteriaceae bacterium]|nr:hypothetical protein [Propionibacteriaceae bacterium]